MMEPKWDPDGEAILLKLLSLPKQKYLIQNMFYVLPVSTV